jgi:hypothetical protein
MYFRCLRKMPHLLELFCGTKSISKVFEQHSWTCTSLDFDPKMEPTICCNILDVTPEMILKHDRPDAIWASPLCTMYSRARTTAKTLRDLDGSDKLVQKVLDLVKHFNVPFFMENPHSGLLKSREVVRCVPMRVLDYCCYADDNFPGRYRKRTSIWTNTDWYPLRPLCLTNVCHFCTDGKRHDHGAQQRASKDGRQPKQSLRQLYSIPSALPEELVSWLGENLEINDE